jgi:D-alanine-D-alanine ligase
MRIAILANLKQNAPKWEGMTPDQWDDLDSPKTVENLVKALEAGGHEAVFFEARIEPPHNLIEKLLEYKPDLCFNIAESHFGDSRESQIPAVLEMLRIPYTGSKVLTLALALDKPMTKRILYYHGLPTPEFQVFERADEPVDADLLNEEGELRFPLFVKPSREGTSMGVTGESIVYTRAQLREQIARQQAQYNQPILVEHYIKGREITVGVIGNLRPTQARRLSDRDALNGHLPEGLTFFPPLEANVSAFPDSENGVYTNRMKVELADVYTYSCPAKIDAALEFELKKLTAAVFQVTGCKDVARVDFRLDADNDDKPYILEINPLPGMTPGFSDLCLEADAAGWTHEQFVNTIVDLAAERNGLLSREMA